MDNSKNLDCIRILLLNSRGFGLDNAEKMEMMMAATKDHSVDGILLSLPDRRWTSSKVD